MVLMRYIPLGCSIAFGWIGVSFCGWLAGWIVIAIAQPAARGLGNEVAGFLAWASLAVFQGGALALLLTFTLRTRSVLALVPLWLVTGVLGAALAMLAGSYLSNALDPPSTSGASSRIDHLVGVIVEQAAAGGIYGVATGVVIAMLVKRLEERRSAGVATNT